MSFPDEIIPPTPQPQSNPDNCENHEKDDECVEKIQ